MGVTGAGFAGVGSLRADSGGVSARTIAGAHYHTPRHDQGNSIPRNMKKNRAARSAAAGTVITQAAAMAKT